MLNFDDYGYNDYTNSAILESAPLIAYSSISVMSNLTNQRQINELTSQFKGQINIHIDLVEGPFLTALDGRVKSLSVEILAQLAQLQEFGVEPSYIDFHQNFHKHPNVLLALMSISPQIESYPIRPLIQSKIMRSGATLSVKNTLATALQGCLKTKINFLQGKVASGLDQCPRESWDEIFDLLSEDNLIVPCHPHIYGREKMFCEYIVKRCGY